MEEPHIKEGRETIPETTPSDGGVRMVSKACVGGQGQA